MAKQGEENRRSHTGGCRSQGTLDRLPQVTSQPNVKQLYPLALQGGRSVPLPPVTPKPVLQGTHRSRMWRGQRGPSGTFLDCLVALSPTAFDQKPTEEGGSPPGL